MRLLVTADLHFNHRKSRGLAEELIAEMNDAGGDGVLLIGDTAAFDGDALEQCLDLVKIPGPRLFVAGNHELWTLGDDSHEIHTRLLPDRIRAAGWHWLEDAPFDVNGTTLIGSVGWYDYSFAQWNLGIPDRFYAAKISPAAAQRLGGFSHLFQGDFPPSPKVSDVVARWNDGRFVKLHRTDEAFLDELLGKLRGQLEAARHRRVIAAVHHLPFPQLLPPPHRAQWDFAKAYLGSEKIGRMLLEYPNVTDVYCGHSHLGLSARVGHIRAMNIGSGYRFKSFLTLDL